MGRALVSKQNVLPPCVLAQGEASSQSSFNPQQHNPTALTEIEAKIYVAFLNNRGNESNTSIKFPQAPQLLLL